MKLIYATFPTHEEAESVAHSLLAEKLIACANILGGFASIYNWQGETRQQQETIMFAKTSDEKAGAAILRINELHSYDLPCAIILPVEHCLPEFAKWVDGEVS